HPQQRPRDESTQAAVGQRIQEIRTQRPGEEQVERVEACDAEQLVREHRASRDRDEQHQQHHAYAEVAQDEDAADQRQAQVERVHPRDRDYQAEEGRWQRDAHDRPEHSRKAAPPRGDRGAGRRPPQGNARAAGCAGHSLSQAQKTLSTVPTTQTPLSLSPRTRPVVSARRVWSLRASIIAQPPRNATFSASAYSFAGGVSKRMTSNSSRIAWRNDANPG